MAVSDDGSWVVGPVELVNGAYVIRVTTDVSQFRELTQHVRIRSAVWTLDKNGFPDTDELNDLRGVFARAARMSEGRAVHVASITTALSFVEYVLRGVPGEWMGPWSEAVMGLSPNMLSVHAADDPNWSRYERLRGLARNGSYDWSTLALIERHGHPGNELLEIRHRLAFPSEILMHDGVAAVEKCGHRAVKGAQALQWVVDVVVRLAPTMSTIMHQRREWQDFAHDHGAVYRGWFPVLTQHDATNE